MLLYYTREKVLEVLKGAFPEQYIKYSKFFIIFSYKEVNKNSSYFFERKGSLLILYLADLKISLSLY